MTANTPPSCNGAPCTCPTPGVATPSVASRIHARLTHLASMVTTPGECVMMGRVRGEIAPMLAELDAADRAGTVSRDQHNAVVADRDNLLRRAYADDIEARAVKDERDGLRRQVARLQAEHDDLVKRNRELRDRPDLQDRAASVDALRVENDRLQRQVDALARRNTDLLRERDAYAAVRADADQRERIIVDLRADNASMRSRLVAIRDAVT